MIFIDNSEFTNGAVVVVLGKGTTIIRGTSKTEDNTVMLGFNSMPEEYLEKQYKEPPQVVLYFNSEKSIDILIEALENCKKELKK